MNFCSLVGTRPQFIKAAILHRELKKRQFEHVVVSTGQHYDTSLADNIFTELDLPIIPLEGSSGFSGIERIFKMRDQLQLWLQNKKFTQIFVYGDCDSTLAAAMACRSLAQPFVHIESGVRVGAATSEEYNRFIVDHLASVNFAFDKNSFNNLIAESAPLSFQSPDLMQELMAVSWEQRKKPEQWPDKKPVLFMTIHRDHNVDKKEVLEGVVEAIDRIAKANWSVFWPLHPRTFDRLKQFSLSLPKNVIAGPPLTYLETLGAISLCQAVLTDSGGLQREASWANLPVFVLLDYKVWDVGRRIKVEDLPNCLISGQAQPVTTCLAAQSIVSQVLHIN